MNEGMEEKWPAQSQSNNADQPFIHHLEDTLSVESISRQTAWHGPMQGRDLGSAHRACYGLGMKPCAPGPDV